MNASTSGKLWKMKFFGMFHAFKSSMETGKANDYAADELLAHLVDAEWDDQHLPRVLNSRYKMSHLNCSQSNYY